MPARRILSLWFPRLAAERVLRLEPSLSEAPFAITLTTGNLLTLTSLSAQASDAGLRREMTLTDARTLCPGLLTRPAEPLREAAFLSALRRWAGQFTPWVAEEPAGGTGGTGALILDITGCAHLFGGEAGLAAQIEDDLARLGLSHRIGLADTIGAAWAITRYARQIGATHRSGDAIDQEARATRSRAHKRRNWERGGPAPAPLQANATAPRIIPPGETRRWLNDLPVAALRLEPDVITNLNRLGLARISDLAAIPRAALGRRFGLYVVRRLDQAFGSEPEPVSPARPELHFATRLTLPDPIGLEEDILAGLNRVLHPLCTKLKTAAQGARRLRLTIFRADHSLQSIEIGLARPSREPDVILPLLKLKLGDLDAGYGIDVIRLEAHVTEPLTPHQHKGHLEATADAQARMNPGGGAAFTALLNRIGTRIGMEALTRLSPADSNIPEKTATIMAAAYSEVAPDWPKPRTRRPVMIFAPEPVTEVETGRPPPQFRWRRRDFTLKTAHGPERISPEWWLDDPNWRSGPRDYWRIETKEGPRLWLFQALGAGGWYAQGDFG